MYEYDVKFPYESQLVVAVKDWESLVGKKSRLIGKTTIDLEDRFYSSCYAMCGLAKSYDSDGYNRWRDLLSPKEILEKLRKKWRLKRPEYTADARLKVTTLNDKVLVYSLTGPSSGPDNFADGYEDTDDDLLSFAVTDNEDNAAHARPKRGDYQKPDLGKPVVFERSDSETDSRIVKVLKTIFQLFYELIVIIIIIRIICELIILIHQFIT